MDWTWDDYGMARAQVSVPGLGWQLTCVMFPEGDQLTPAMLARLAEVCAMPSEQRPVLQALLWDHPRFTFHVADYGVQPREGEDTITAHLRDFEVPTPDAVLAATTPRSLHIFEEHDGLSHRLATLTMEAVTGDLIDVVIRDGVFVGVDDNGINLSDYEDNPTYAADMRARHVGDGWK